MQVAIGSYESEVGRAQHRLNFPYDVEKDKSEAQGSCPRRFPKDLQGRVWQWVRDGSSQILRELIDLVEGGGFKRSICSLSPKCLGIRASTLEYVAITYHGTERIVLFTITIQTPAYASLQLFCWQMPDRK